MKASTNGTTLQDPSRVSALIKEAPTKEATTKPRKKGKKLLLRWLALPVVILGVIAGVWYWLYSSQFEDTDDAYVTGHEHPVSFRVAGTISEVLVDDNQLVKQGQPIAKLDPKDFQVALAQAKASLEQAKAQLGQSQAQLIQTDAQLKQARAQADAAKAQDINSERNFQRNYQLFYQGKGVISKQDLDNTQYQAEGNEATYNATVAAVNVAEANVQTAKAQEKAAAAQVEVASAQVQNAELQLSYTTVYAPTDGRGPANRSRSAWMLFPITNSSVRSTAFSLEPARCLPCFRQTTQLGISRKSCSGFPSRSFSIEPAFEGTSN